MENVKNDSNIYPSFSLAFFTDFRGFVRRLSPILPRTSLHHPFPTKAPAMQATFVSTGTADFKTKRNIAISCGATQVV